MVAAESVRGETVSDVKLYLGDCLEVMRGMDADSVDSIVTDPPYGLEFMGKEWDKLSGTSWRNESEADREWMAQQTGNASLNARRRNAPDYGQPGPDMQDWHYRWAVEALRVAKPGAHMLAFGGTRTHHRLMCAIEDAGWEIRDVVMWVYGSGFPKSLDVSKAIDKAAGAERTEGAREWKGGKRHNNSFGGGSGQENGTTTLTKYDVPATPDALRWQGWGTNLKPAYEPVIVARKPLIGTVAANVLEHGTGGINIDGCRVGGVVPQVTQGGQRSRGGIMNATGGERGTPSRPHTLGRWPANVCHDGSDEVTALFPNSSGGAFPKTVKGASPIAFRGDEQREARIELADAGSAARFFMACPFTEEDNEWLHQENSDPCVRCADSPCAVCETPIAVGVAETRTWDTSNGESPATAASTGNSNGCTPTLSPAPCAERQESTGIIPTTASRSRSCGSVSPVIIASTLEIERTGQRRFTYCPKASKSDRDEGLPDGEHSSHPTVKPTALMRWLVRLVTPPGGVVLDPFMGSGSTGKAAALEGFDFVGIEIDAEYLEIAQLRTAIAQPTMGLFG